MTSQKYFRKHFSFSVKHWLQSHFKCLILHGVAIPNLHRFVAYSGCRQDEKVSKTISLCTGMQSSTLAMLLATQFLGGSHAVPPACSVVVMAVMGLSLGSFWGKGNRVRDLGNSFYTCNEAYT